MFNSPKIRFVLVSLLFVFGYLLFQRFEETQISKPATSAEKALHHSAPSSLAIRTEEVPEAILSSPLESTPTQATNGSSGENMDGLAQIPADRIVQIKTDTLILMIDKLGGDIIQADLPQYDSGRVWEKERQDFRLLDDSSKRFYVAQSGLVSARGPDSRELGRALFDTAAQAYDLPADQDRLVVDLYTETPHSGAIQVTKRFTFYRGKYHFDIAYIVNNRSTTDFSGVFYGRLKRSSPTEKSGGFFGVQTYTGAALSTEAKPYQKVTFKEIQDRQFQKITEKGGWIAMIEHYFLSAFIPPKQDTNTYDTELFMRDDRIAYGIQFYTPLRVAAHSHGEVTAQAYLGPLVTEDLAGLAPGLELTVDYGIFWPICKPIFWILKNIENITGNWGVAIILTTLLIKLLFYRLSASSYRSMGNMKRLQPKIEALKAQYGDDKQGFGQAMMKLYRQEKVNPLGGCLPILVQIPVFIALYYVLLGSVELREAPFFGWIQDLSARDPYYILPLLMGLTMFLQQKMNPAPADPIQAKMMLFMPVVFTVLFLQFPSGLVLYWVVNNLLSILQQWYISRHLNHDNKRQVKRA